MESSARLLDLPTVLEPRGNLTHLEEQAQLPFAIGHVSWIYGVPQSVSCGGREWRGTNEVIVALSGRVDVAVHDGESDSAYRLDRPTVALLAPAERWLELRDVSSDALLLIVASRECDEGDPRPGLPRLPDGAGAALNARHTTVAECAVVGLSNRDSDEGSVTAVQTGPVCPFRIRRVYYTLDVPAGAARGGHAHRELQQLIVAARGSFDARLDDGRSCRTVTLDRPDRALRLVPGIWRELDNFSAGSICLVIASDVFDEGDYLRDYAEFQAFKAGPKG